MEWMCFDSLNYLTALKHMMIVSRILPMGWIWSIFQGLAFYSIREGGGATATASELRYVYSTNSDRTYVMNDVNDFQFFFDGDYRGLLTADDFLLDTPAGPITIDGTAGNDTLVGIGGEDHIIGGLGGDTLTGGAGIDHFIYTDVNDSQKFGAKDRTTDFEDGTDLIDLSVLPFYSITTNPVTVVDQINIIYNANLDLNLRATGMAFLTYSS